MLQNASQTEIGSRFKTSRASSEDYELHFRSLINQAGGYSFPCDASGRVDLDALGERARSNYFFARTLIGRDFSVLVTPPGDLH